MGAFFFMSENDFSAISHFLSKSAYTVPVCADTTREVIIMIYPDLYALLHSEPEAGRHFETHHAHGRDSLEHHIPAANLEDLRKGAAGNPFPLGVYPVFDDDVPRDNSFENFSAPDLKDLHPYPRGLR